MLTRVVSGGQTGVDQAALRAAKRAGLATGGWLPFGCRTLDGLDRRLLNTYGMTEHPRRSYRDRTFANVRDSDGTLRIAETFSSLGERCTLNAIRYYRKPFLDLHLVCLTPRVWSCSVAPEAVLVWLQNPAHAIETLNVAGNSEQTAPGIGAHAEDLLFFLFQTIRDERSP